VGHSTLSTKLPQSRSG